MSMQQGVHFGSTPLPDEQAQALRKAKRLQVVSVVYLVTAVTVVFIVMGSSQAMRAAWIEDCLSFLPPVAFLVAARRASEPPSPEYPYGHHRVVGAAHLTAAVALLTLGSFIFVESLMTLVLREHPTIGTVYLFGHTVWLGWLMMAALVYTGLPNVLLGRMKMSLAEKLHDKVLFSDADMNRADWMTAGGAMLGVLGIGLGWWWADSLVASAISASIVKDGISNIKAAVAALLDRRARTYNDEDDHPALDLVDRYFRGLPWVKDVGVRMRDQGHVFHTEVFVVPDGEPSLRQLEQARDDAAGLDWKLADLVVIPVSAIDAAFRLRPD